MSPRRIERPGDPRIDPADQRQEIGAQRLRIGGAHVKGELAAQLLCKGHVDHRVWPRDGRTKRVVRDDADDANLARGTRSLGDAEHHAERRGPGRDRLGRLRAQHGGRVVVGIGQAPACEKPDLHDVEPRGGDADERRKTVGGLRQAGQAEPHAVLGRERNACHASVRGCARHEAVRELARLDRCHPEFGRDRRRRPSAGEERSEPR